MDKVVIKKHDKNRFLLTETLPYETPLFYSNIGFYKLLKNEINKDIEDILIGNQKDVYIPYSFNIKKGDNGLRTISIPHPASQYRICELIHNNAELVTYLCSKSSFSIRKPTRVASYYYNSDNLASLNKNYEKLIDDDVEQQGTIKDEDFKEHRYASSYFSYDGYTLIYKFYNSLKFQSLEKKYSHYLKFDIAKCFNSIYTHSISWAIKGKKYSKENAGSYSFDDEFDRVIRSMNDGETNGIIIGPEFSRIFAEVILQKVDISVEKEMLSLGYINKVDYEVKRYVDDYFVFTKSDHVADLIYDLFISQLEFYKLFINESKTVKDRRPFITNLTMAKLSVSDSLNDFFKSIKRDVTNEDAKKDIPSIVNIYKPYSRSNKLITRFKSIVKSSNTNYDAFSGLILSIFRKRLLKLLNEVNGINNIVEYSSCYRNYIIFSLDFLFFIYSMNVRVSTSQLMSQIFVIIHDICRKISVSDKLEIEKKIKDEIKLLISNFIESKSPKVELINTLISLRSVYGKNIIKDELVIRFFNVDLNGDGINSLNYFELTSLLYLCCMTNDNEKIRDSIYNSLINRLEVNSSPRHSSELMHLLLDLGTFPYRSESLYKKSLSIYLNKIKGKKPKQADINKLFNCIKDERFFIDWSNNININLLLQRKEMLKGYDS